MEYLYTVKMLPAKEKIKSYNYPDWRPWMGEWKSDDRFEIKKIISHVRNYFDYCKDRYIFAIFRGQRIPRVTKKGRALNNIKWEFKKIVTF